MSPRKPQKEDQSPEKGALHSPPEVDELVNQIGEFIQYWGFKNVQGRIWAHLYISSSPLDAAQLMSRLKISKALVSISIREMIEYEVIEEAGKSEKGTMLYRANSNQEKVILNVLRRRERMMLSRVSSAHRLCSGIAEREKKKHQLSKEGLEKMGAMILNAETVLDMVLRADEPDHDMWNKMGDALADRLKK